MHYIGLIDKVYIDGANPSFIKSLKLPIGEDADYDKVIARYRSDGLGNNWSQDMRIVPVNFNKNIKQCLRQDVAQNSHDLAHVLQASIQL